MRHYSLKYVPQWYLPYRVRHWFGRGEVTVDIWGPRFTVGLHYKRFRGCRLASFALLVGELGNPRTLYPYHEEYDVNKRLVRTAEPGAKLPTASTKTKWFNSAPCLIQHCAAVQYDDGTTRKPGWFTVTTFGTGWKVTVKDPDSAASVSFTAPTIDEALMAAEMHISDPSSPWEPDEWLKQAKPRRKRG